jgi:AI-2 transport protein TqsA
MKDGVTAKGEKPKTGQGGADIKPAPPVETPPVPEATPRREAATPADPPADLPAADGEGRADHGNPLLRGPLRFLLGLACTVIVVYGMRYASDVLSPILLALFIVMGISPAIRWLRRKGVPGWATLVIMLVIFVVVGLLFVSVLAVSLFQFQAKIPAYTDRLESLYSSVDGWLSAHGVDAGDLLGSLLSPAKLAGIAKGVVTGIFSAFGNVLLMFLVVIFMIAEIFQFPAKVEARFGAESRFGKAVGVFGQETRSYLFMKTWLAIIPAAINTAVFYGLGVDFPLLWGMLFFLLSYIPNIGFIISIIPPFAVTLLEQGFTRAIIVLAIILVINFVVDSLVSPRIMGRGLGLTSLAVLLSLIVWAWVLGPVGALMSVPLTIMVKRLFLESFESTQFLSDALSTPLLVKAHGKTRGGDPA